MMNLLPRPSWLPIVLVILLAVAAQGEDLLRAWDLGIVDSDDLNIYRVWYGDGRAYVGPNIPPTVKNALNITVNEDRRDLLFVQVDRENNAKNAPRLPDPTFIVVDVAPKSAGSFFFAHSAVGLDHDKVYLFALVEGFWFPRTRSSIARGGTYLVPTEAEGTYQVRWFVDDGDARRMGARPATLATRGIVT